MFWLYSMVFALLSLLIYCSFRSGIYDYLRLSKMSKTYIRKNRKGVKNYWFYTQIHQQHSLGYLYYLNAVFLSLLVTFLIFVIVFALFDFAKFFIMVLTVILCLVELPAIVIFSRFDALAEYGSPFILLAKRKENVGYYSSILYIAFWIIPAALTILCVKDYFG